MNLRGYWIKYLTFSCKSFLLNEFQLKRKKPFYFIHKIERWFCSMYWFSTTDIRKWRAIHRGGAEGIWEDADGRGREEEAAGGL